MDSKDTNKRIRVKLSTSQVRQPLCQNLLLLYNTAPGCSGPINIYPLAHCIGVLPHPSCCYCFCFKGKKIPKTLFWFLGVEILRNR